MRRVSGTTAAHVELEQLVARFVGKEDCIVYNMGYGTNATTIPALCSAVRAAAAVIAVAVAFAVPASVC